MIIKGKKIITGFGWVAIGVYSNKVFGFITTLILAKLLTPEDFGLVAVASIVIQILHLFKDMGLSQALIYRKGDIEVAANSAFWMVVGLNIIIFLLASASSSFIASFYNNRMVMPVIILLSSNLVWNSIRAVPTSLIQKSIDFQKLIIPEVIPVICASVLSIVLAVLGFGVWSLVARSLCVGISGMLLIWKFTKFRPSLSVNIKIAKELFGYGKYIVGASIIVVILYNIDKFYVSKIEGITILGFYELAMRIANMPVSEFSHLVGRVMFPVLCKINRDFSELQRAFLKTIKYSSMISTPMAIGILVYGPSLIKGIYGEKWIPMIEPLQILSIYAMLRSWSNIIYDCFKAIGKPDLVQRFLMFKMISIGLLGFFSLKFFGLKGICYLIVIAYFASFIMEGIKVCNLLSIRLSVLLSDIGYPLILSGIIIPAIYYGVSKLDYDFFLVPIMVGIGITIPTYFFLTILYDKKILNDIKATLTA